MCCFIKQFEGKGGEESVGLFRLCIGTGRDRGECLIVVFFIQRYLFRLFEASI